MKNQIDDLGVVGVVVEDWDISREYKAKTITTDYSTWIVYISRKNVPAYTPITDNNYWKPLTRLTTELAFNYNTFKEVMERKINDLTLQVNTFLSSVGGTLAIAKEFGDNDNLAVSQSTVTNAINKLWDKFEEVTGEVYQGINMVITPTYFIGEDGCDVSITANTVEANGIFEKIAFYFNDDQIPVVEGENVTVLTHSAHIIDTTIVTCKAKIMGIVYTREGVIRHHSSFWLGGGSTYEDIIDVEHVISIDNNMRGAYNVTVEEGQHIIIVVAEGLQEGFIRADINSVEIPFTEELITVDDNSYRVFTSINTYHAGTYNIDING